MIRVVDFFSGIGGFSYGLELAGGFETVAFVENDNYASKVLEKHWPDVPNLGDLNGLTEIPEADMWTGGFPCQPFSQAGARRGTDDERHLWPVWFDAIRQHRPRYLLAENVPGLLTVDDGRVFGRIVSDLAEAGYVVEWSIISAADVGAPHLRKRLWIWAELADSDNPRLEGRRDDAGEYLSPGQRRTRKRQESKHGESRQADQANAPHPHADQRRCEVERQQEHTEQQSERGREPDRLRSRRPWPWEIDPADVETAESSGDLRSGRAESTRAHGDTEGGGEVHGRDRHIRTTSQENGSPDVCDTEKQPERPGLRENGQTGERGRRSGNTDCPFCGADQGPAPRLLDGMVDGVCAGVDGPRFTGRVAQNQTNRIHRLRCLGNAVVPACVAWIGRRIRERIEEDKP